MVLVVPVVVMVVAVLVVVVIVAVMVGHLACYYCIISFFAL